MARRQHSAILPLRLSLITARRAISRSMAAHSLHRTLRQPPSTASSHHSEPHSSSMQHSSSSTTLVRARHSCNRNRPRARSRSLRPSTGQDGRRLRRPRRPRCRPPRLPRSERHRPRRLRRPRRPRRHDQRMRPTPQTVALRRVPLTQCTYIYVRKLGVRQASQRMFGHRNR